MSKFPAPANRITFMPVKVTEGVTVKVTEVTCVELELLFEERDTYSGLPEKYSELKPVEQEIRTLKQQELKTGPLKTGGLIGTHTRSKQKNFFI